MYGGNDAAKKELLKDVSSFANTEGGDLLIGIDEDAGVPTNIVGLTSITRWFSMRAGAFASGRRPSVGRGGSSWWVEVMGWRDQRPFFGSGRRAEGCRGGRVCDPEGNARR